MNRGLGLVSLLGGMGAGSFAVNMLMKPDMTCRWLLTCSLGQLVRPRVPGRPRALMTAPSSKARLADQEISRKNNHGPRLPLVPQFVFSVAGLCHPGSGSGPGAQASIRIPVPGPATELRLPAGACGLRKYLFRLPWLAALLSMTVASLPCLVIAVVETCLSFLHNMSQSEWLLSRGQPVPSSVTSTLRNYIGGEFRGPAGGAHIQSRNPATGLVETLVPQSTEPDVVAAVSAATAAFEPWAALSKQVRSTWMLRIAAGIEARLEAFAAAESRDQGKPVALARMVDIPRAIANFRYFAGILLHHQEVANHVDLPRGGVSFSYTQRHPVGVAALISPWNLPLYLLTWKIAPCIAYGCTAVCKPSEFTSRTAHMLAELLDFITFPPGVINFVFGDGPSAGTPLVTHPDVGLVSFTGGTVTGRKIHAMCASGPKKMSLELGGKNPCIIFDDADLSEAVAGAVRSGFANQGEICLCGSRVYVQKGIYEEFLKLFVAKVNELKVGDPTLPETNLGPLVSRPHLDKVLSYLRIAQDTGGNFLAGGPDFPTADLPKGLQGGYFMSPTVITGVPVDGRCATEEIFGPVVTVHPFDSEADVIRLANSTDYGLAASVWTSNYARANRVSRRIKCGICWINCWMVREDLSMPFGGVKGSGLGREGGHDSIDFFTDVTTVVSVGQ